jgi:hypothetical protein
MDGVSDLPESTNTGNTGMLVIVDRLTKMKIYQSCQKDIDYPEVARWFFKLMTWNHVVLNNIISNQGTQFTR